MTRWTVPPVRYPFSCDRFSVSATTPWPAKAASPWTRIGSTVSGGVAQPILPGAGHPLDDRVDRLEVARVRRQAEPDLLPSGRDVGAGGAEVVLHVSGAVNRLRVETSSNSSKICP